MFRSWQHGQLLFGQAWHLLVVVKGKPTGSIVVIVGVGVVVTVAIEIIVACVVSGLIVNEYVPGLHLVILFII